ncbi:MAG: dienelactone hydrolase family protein [Actinomycetota bacterium]|nr:dienelactone hydrolase family protein [Actinomycetota bacterium]
MDPNLQYVAEEIAENCAEGQLSRREAMRRLAYLGFSTASASALLAACGDDDDESASSQTPTTQAQATTAPPGTTGTPVAAQNITYPGKDITLQGVFAPAQSPRGAVLVIHENRGITEFVRTITGRLAGSGYTALAVDLLSAQGGTAAHPDPAQLQAVLVQNASTRAVDDMKSSLTELEKRAPGAKLGATGFCFGGNMTWMLLAAGDPPTLSAAIPFYGTIQNEDLSKTKAAVMGVYAENDQRVNATRETARSALEKAGLQHEIKTYPGVNHAFMNQTGMNYNETQANAAYQAMVDWFGRYLR